MWNTGKRRIGKRMLSGLKLLTNISLDIRGTLAAISVIINVCQRTEPGATQRRIIFPVVPLATNVTIVPRSLSTTATIKATITISMLLGEDHEP